MKFVPVPVPGTQVLFSIWDTRVKDYRAYAETDPDMDVSWKSSLKFKQGEDHPVVEVSWVAAKAFCDWLTRRERKSGMIGKDQAYRLPTDAEWSIAAGNGRFPWGNEWPPPKGAGNFEPYFKTDDFEHTSPVGSFKANACGLYDMGGNVAQWCEDWYDKKMNSKALLENNPALENDLGGRRLHVIRGSAWNTVIGMSEFSSWWYVTARRDSADPLDHAEWIGFRCVLASGVASQ